MECNKDEAIRAKEIALKKMQSNDFDGARRIALKAQQLYPDLENISHLIAACNVHCFAENKLLGSEKDWYSILQVERLADDATIKKQYRKLALLLHPDKNKFPGAEAAFKLVGEAHLVLSDHGRRSLYDSKLEISIKAAQSKPPTQQMNKDLPVKKQHRFQKSTSSHFSNEVNGLNQTPQSNPSFGHECFWTCCPFCNIKYQYFKSCVNRALRCQKCTKPFIAYDIASQGIPPRTNQSQAGTQSIPTASNWRQPSFFKQNEIPVSGSHKSGTRVTAGFQASSSGFQGAATSRKDGSDIGTKETGGFQAFSSGFPGTATNRKVDSDSGVQTRPTVGVGSHFGNSCSSVGGEGKGVSPCDIADAKPGKEASVIGNKRKRGKKKEMNKSCDTSSSRESEDVIGETNADLSANQYSGVTDYECRRSSRQKHQVSYIESEGEDEGLANPGKKSQNGKSFAEKAEQECTNGAIDTENPLKEEKSDTPKGRIPEENNLNGKIQTTVQSAGASENDVKRVETIDDSMSDADSGDEHDPVVFHCPDPDFNDFDKDREQSCFAANQFWACYGNADGMPRYYALISKVLSPGFKLRITWLEPDPDPENENEINWVDSELPIGCGKYKRGGSQLTTDCFIFSHQIVCDKGSKRGSFSVYPRKGEIWALFKNWDIKWCSEPEKHESFNFEVAEVLSDFTENVGIRVALLDKVRGFVSLYHRRGESSSGEFVIEPKEILRFSHRIPSFKMNGTEKKGVPQGSFELDPASLPLKPNGVCSPLIDMDAKKGLGVQGNSACQDSPDVKNKSKKSGKLSTPKKSDDPCSKRGCSDDEDSVLRRSPRGLNGVNKEKKKANASNPPAESLTADNVSGSEARNGKAEVLSSQAGEIHESSAKRRTDNTSSKPISCNIGQEAVFHDFSSDRSSEQFAVGQIWALYKPEDQLPKIYGQIRKIAHGPLMLHVVIYEEYPVTKKGVNQVVGAFKLQNARSRPFEPSRFSHLVDADITNKSKIEVYPKEGQVWAVFKNWNTKSSSSTKNCEYDVVLIVGNSDGHVKASPLVAVKGYKSVYRPARSSRSSFGSMDIVIESEVGRFSHQIPAFQLTAEKGGANLVGLWELDHAAVLPSK